MYSINFSEEDLMTEIQAYGKRVVTARKEAKLTQKQVADNLGITKQAVFRIEKGINKSINQDFLRQLAIILKCSTDYLEGNSNDPKNTKKLIPFTIVRANQIDLKAELISMTLKDVEFTRACIECDKQLKPRDRKRLLDIMKIFLK
jgi:transcriptional regulator with XRE-family HTH domain